MIIYILKDVVVEDLAANIISTSVPHLSKFGDHRAAT